MQAIVFEFLESIKTEEKILVFGAGKVAERLCKAFDKKGKVKGIEAFIVSNKENNKSEINGIRVRGYKDYLESSKKIVIGLCETSQEEIYTELIKSGFSDNRIIKIPFMVNKALEYMDEGDKKWQGSDKYWNERYKKGGNSGSGSYNRLAEFKAEIINKFVKDYNIYSVIEWGCGDGNQLSMANYTEYLGYDVSEKAIDICRKRFMEDKTKKFIWCGGKSFTSRFKADLTLSLDVIYHLVEDEVFQIYMDRLFNSSIKYVCIYSCDFNNDLADYIKCRKFTDYIKANYGNWNLIKYVPNRYPYESGDPDNTSWSDFFFYKKQF